MILAFDMAEVSHAGIELTAYYISQITYENPNEKAANNSTHPGLKKLLTCGFVSKLSSVCSESV